MFRSQIYLTKTERTQLQVLSRQTGHSQSELIREAIDLFIEINLRKAKTKLADIQAMKGMWVDRDDLSELETIRKEFDR